MTKGNASIATIKTLKLVKTPPKERSSHLYVFIPSTEENLEITRTTRTDIEDMLKKAGSNGLTNRNFTAGWDWTVIQHQLPREWSSEWYKNLTDLTTHLRLQLILTRRIGRETVHKIQENRNLQRGKAWPAWLRQGQSLTALGQLKSLTLTFTIRSSGRQDCVCRHCRNSSLAPIIAHLRSMDIVRRPRRVQEELGAWTYDGPEGSDIDERLEELRKAIFRKLS